jgi:hypothetical protein
MYFYACSPNFVKKAGIIGVAGNYVRLNAHINLAL